MALIKELSDIRSSICFKNDNKYSHLIGGQIVMNSKRLKRVSVLENYVEVDYSSVRPSTWRRVRKAAHFLSDNDLGPKVDSTDDLHQIFTTEKINMFDAHNPPKDMSPQEAKDAIDESVHKYNLGWIHGDLAISNVGYRDDLTVVFVDYDTIHEVKGEHPPDLW